VTSPKLLLVVGHEHLKRFSQAVMIEVIASPSTSRRKFMSVAGAAALSDNLSSGRAQTLTEKARVTLRPSKARINYGWIGSPRPAR